MEFGVLGPLEISGRDARLQVPGRKERGLLAVLLARRGRVVSQGELVDALWGDRVPPTAERTLQAYVSRVRAAALGERLRRAGAGWVLELPAETVDSGRFETSVTVAQQAVRDVAWVEALGLAETALGYWRGEAFEGHLGLEPCAAEGERLGALRSAVDELTMECRLALGRAGEVVDRLQELVSEEPYRENRWEMLMIALYRTGRQSEALEAYRLVRRILRDELGVDPGPALQRVHDQVLAHDAQLLAPLQSVGGPVNSTPYLGLASYRAADAAVFVGRERLVARVLAQLGKTGIVTVAGSSGSGKSSLVHGGVLPALRAGGLPGSHGWRQAVVRAGAVAELSVSGPDLIVVDQLEELFTQCDAPTRRRFAESLAVRSSEGARLLLALRSDYWAKCAAEPALVELVSGSSVLVGVMDEQELRRVATEPARRFGVTVDPELVERVVAEVGGRDGVLPLVSTALARAWERHTGAQLTVADYHAAGGMRDAIGRLAEEVVAPLGPEEQAVVKKMLLRLTAEGRGGVVRQRVPEGELLAACADTGRVLSHLAEGRLLIAGSDGVEVIHEALFTAWPRLEAWLQEDATARRLRAHLTPAAAEWESRGRREEDLYTGARLAEAVTWLDDTDAALLDRERQFVEAGQARADQERHRAQERAVREARFARRLRVLLGAVLTLLLVVGVTAVLAVRARRVADVAETHAVAGRLGSDALLEPRPDRALLLARQALALHDGPVTRSALFGALQRFPRLIRVTDTGQQSVALRLDPLGEHLLVCTATGRIAMYDARKLRAVRIVGPRENTSCGPLAFMDDGRLFATARQRSSLGADLEIRSVASGALQAQVPIDDGWWISASPNGSALVTSSILGSYATTRRAGVWTAQRIGGEARTTNVTGAEEFGYSAPGEAVSVRRLPDARVVRRLPGTRGLEAAALTEDGELALLAGGTEIRLTNARTGRVRRVVSAPGPYSEVFFADQDRLLVVASVDDEVTVWERRTGRLLAAITSSGAHAEVSPDGTTLFTLSAAGTLAAWDLTGTRMFGQQYDVPADITAASFTDSGDVVVGTSTGEVTWLDGDDLTERSSVDAGARVVDLEPVAGTEMLAITPDHVIRIATHRQHLKVSGSIAVQGASDAAESSDGVLALAVDRGRGAMLIAPGGEVTTLALTAEKSLAGAVYAEQWGHVDWSPDGELLAAAANDGRVYLFGPTGHRLGVIQPHDTGLAPAVAFLDATTLLIGDRQGRVRPVNPRTQSPTGPPLDAASATPVRIAVARDLAVVGSMGSGVALLDTKAGVRYGNDLLAAGTEMLVPLLDDDLTLTVFAPEGVARRWPGDPQDWAARACATAGRALTQDEWQHHLAGRDYDPAC